MKDAVVIAFAGGTYGTYLHWALDTLTKKGAIIPPWGKHGTSHRFKGTHYSTHWREHWHDQGHDIVRLHPKHLKEESLAANLDQITSRARKVIHLYPDQQTYLLSIHNYLFKVWDDLWAGPLAYVDPKNLYDNWSVDPKTPLPDVAPWILREFFSYNLFTAWESLVEWFLPERYADSPKHQFLFVGELLFDYQNTMERLRTQLDLTYIRSIQDMLPYHEINLANQRYLDQQNLAERILHAITEDRDMSWQGDRLTVYTEAWIQKRLREFGLGLKCHGLDLLPDNSVKFKQLLYSL